jgi:hypothetical protein
VLGEQVGRLDQVVIDADEHEVVDCGHRGTLQASVAGENATLIQAERP